MTIDDPAAGGGGFSPRPLKRSVSAGAAVPVQPGSPSGSDVSESSVPAGAVSPSHVFRPVPFRPPPVETTSSSDDGPATSLSLSLPGVDSSEVSNRVTTAAVTSSVPFLPVTAIAAPAPVAAQPLNLSSELMAVMHEMIKMEVRSYMEQQNGMCFQGVDGFRNVPVKRIGISRVDS